MLAKYVQGPRDFNHKAAIIWQGSSCPFM